MGRIGEAGGGSLLRPPASGPPDRRHCDDASPQVCIMFTPVSQALGSSDLVHLQAPRRSFDDLYRSYFDYVARSVRRLGVEGSQIDDAVQDVFIVMHRRLDDLRPGASPKAFLFGIAMRVANGYRRTVRRKGTASLEVASLADGGRSPFDWTASSQAALILQRFLGGLDSDRRAVFLLAELEEMSAPEISRALQVNLSTVYTRLRAARQRFVAHVVHVRGSAREHVVSACGCAREQNDGGAPSWNDRDPSRAGALAPAMRAGPRASKTWSHEVGGYGRPCTSVARPTR